MTLPHTPVFLRVRRDWMRRRSLDRFVRALLVGTFSTVLVILFSSRATAGDDVPTWLKPFAWTNPESKQNQQSQGQELSPWVKPLQYRSDTYVEYSENEYSDNEPTFETVKQPFNWSNPRDTTNDESFRYLSDDEQIAFEREHYVWIRPFYWSNREEVAEEAPWESYPEQFEEPAARSRWLAPFQWRNLSTEQSRIVSQLAQVNEGLWRLPPVGATKTDSRTVAYLMQDSDLPPAKTEGSDSSSGPANGEEITPQEQLEGMLGSDVPENLEELEAPTGKLGEGEGAIAEAESLGSEPEDNYSLQFLRADTVLLSPGEMQFDYGFTYQLLDITFPVINGSSELEMARFRQRELLLPLEVRYGFTRKLQLFANAPFGWSNVELNWSDFENFENDGGFGDLTFGGTFLLREGDQCCSDIVWTNACTAPTGLDPFAPVTGIPNAPSLGNGTWSLSSTLLFIRTYDPLVVFYGFGTRQHFDRDINGQRFEAGQEYNYQMGVGFAVNSKVTFSTRFNGAYVTEARLDGNRILGSIQEPMVVQLALTVAQCKGLIEPFVDIGLTDESIESRFGIVWTRF